MKQTLIEYESSKGMRGEELCEREKRHTESRVECHR